MASIQEILQLDRNQASIKKIDIFLQNKEKLSEDYMLAISYKARILHSLKRSNDGLRLLLPLVNELKLVSYESMLGVCDSIIYIYLDLDMFNEANKYISLKKNYLPASRLNLYLKDKIKLYLKMKDNRRAKEVLNQYLSDDLSKPEQMYAKEELSKIYYEEKQYDKYLELASSLEGYYSEYVFLDKLSFLALRRLEIAFYNKNYLKVVTDGNKFLEETSRVDYILSCASLCIRAYIELLDYKKASIFESYYEDYATDEHPKEALEFSLAALELYTKTNSQVSIKEYDARIKHLEEIINPVDKKRKKRAKPEDSEEIIVEEGNTINIRPSESFITPSVKILNPEQASNKMPAGLSLSATKLEGAISDSLLRLRKVFNEINNIDVNLGFREIYRRALIELTRLYPIDNIYLLYYKDGYRGLEYRHERAYDRKISFNEIEDTLAYGAIRYNSTLALDFNTESYLIDISSKEKYHEEEFAISIPLKGPLEVIGSLTFRGEPSMLKDLSLDAISLIAEIINNRLLLSFKEENERLNNQKLYFIAEAMPAGIKEEKDSYIHLNKRATEILGSFENMTDVDYFHHMNRDGIMAYKNAREEIYNRLSQGLRLEYEYLRDDNKKIIISEILYSIERDGNIIIYSLINDITSEYLHEKRLKGLAYTNPISKCETELRLREDLAKLDSKLSLAILELGDFSLYKEIYGYNFSNQLILALANTLKEAISNDFNLSLYHLERDRFSIIFKGSNDKRIIEAKLRSIFISSKEALKGLNNRLNVSFNAGIYRQLSTKSLRPDEIISNAYDALYDALRMEGSYPHIAHYDSEASKERLKEGSLITHISEAIDANLIGLTYKQIISLKDKCVYGYNAIINLDNYEIDKTYMDRVIDRRGLRKRVDKYSLNKLLQEERIIYDELKGYIRMFIEVAPEAIDISLYDYLNSLADYYKLERENIIIKASNTKSPALKALRASGFWLMSDNILDVYKEACDYLSFDYHEVGIDSINEIIELCNKHSCICILGGIDSRADIELCQSRGYDLIYGDYYRKLNRVQSIIENIKK